MTVSSTDFLDFATDSVKDNTEIANRMAVGRSYYAMYHRVLALLTKPPYGSTNGGSHQALVDYLQRSKEEPFDSFKLRRLAIYLTQGKTLRHVADYDLDSDDITNEVAIQQMEQATSVFDLCKELSESQAS